MKRLLIADSIFGGLASFCAVVTVKYGFRSSNTGEFVLPMAINSGHQSPWVSDVGVAIAAFVAALISCRIIKPRNGRRFYPIVGIVTALIFNCIVALDWWLWMLAGFIFDPDPAGKGSNVAAFFFGPFVFAFFGFMISLPIAVIASGMFMLGVILVTWVGRTFSSAQNS